MFSSRTHKFSGNNFYCLLQSILPECSIEGIEHGHGFHLRTRGIPQRNTPINSCAYQAYEMCVHLSESKIVLDMAFPLDYCKISIFLSFSEKGQTLTKHTGMTVKKNNTGNHHQLDSCLESNQTEFKRRKIHFKVALPRKNHCIIAELVKYTLAGQSRSLRDKTVEGHFFLD